MVCVCVSVRGLGGSMCLCVSFQSYCVLFYEVFCSWCPCVCYVFACCACGVLCDVVGFLFRCVCLCGCFVNMFV